MREVDIYQNNEATTVTGSAEADYRQGKIPPINLNKKGPPSLNVLTMLNFVINKTKKYINLYRLIFVPVEIPSYCCTKLWVDKQTPGQNRHKLISTVAKIY